MNLDGSALVQRSDLRQLITHIEHNDKRSFKEGIQNFDRDDLFLILLETIRMEEREYFEIIVDNLYRNIKAPNYDRPDYYKQCRVAVGQCNDPYFISRILDIHKNIIQLSEKRTLLHLAVRYQNPAILHHLIRKGADVNALNAVGKTPLEIAINKKNLELVCMLLYYGAHINYTNDITSEFMYALLHKSSHEIQRLFIDYETDFNSNFEGMSMLLLAIEAKSPLIMEIIDRGADINYYSDQHNVISKCLTSACDPEIFRKLWNNFDYKIWQNSYNKSVLMKFLYNGMPLPIWREYLKILMENESNLRLDLEHHRNSYFFTSDMLICNFYLSCLEKGIGGEISERYVMHLLSHGARILTKDVDALYNTLGVCTPFLKSLMYMDLHTVNDGYCSFMYFKYTLTPDLDTFMTKIARHPSILFRTLPKLKMYYAFTNELQNQILDIIGAIHDEYYKKFEKFFKLSAKFPSLKELTRDAARKVICLQNNIKTSCTLHTIIRHSTLPKCLQDVLLFELPIYF